MGSKGKAPGKAHRKGISFLEAMELFGDNVKAEQYFESQRWPDGVKCPFCAGENVYERKNRKPQPYHCRACRKDFSAKTGTIMHSSPIPYNKWALAFYFLSTNLKGVSSMKLHRDLDITQKAAWHLAHRIRETWEDAQAPFIGPVEVDETYVGGREGNKHASKRRKAGRGAVGKVPVVGVKDRPSGKVKLEVVESTDKETLQGIIHETTNPETVVYTDGAKAYVGMDREHEVVNHTEGEYVRGTVTTNGIESNWALFKRGFTGVYHKMSPKHLHRYVNEFEGRHNCREQDTFDQMAGMVRGGDGKRLPYQELIAGKVFGPLTDGGKETTQELREAV